jgi:WD40 repeat protein
MERVVREVVKIAPDSPERGEAQEAEIKSCVEEALKNSGRDGLAREEISVEFEPPRGNGEPVQVAFTLRSGLARDVFRQAILPSLMKRYKLIYEPAEQAEPVEQAEPEKQSPAPYETASETTPETEESQHTSAAPDESPAVPFPSLTELMAKHAELLQRELEMKSPVAPEFLTEVKNFIRNGRETGKSLDSANERRAAQSLLNYWITVLYRAGETDAPDAILAPYTRLETLDLDQAKCPYIGLRPFSEADREVFFGRKELTNSIVSRMQEQHLIALVGPSGSGKTSVISAGVLPALREGKAVEGSEHWHYFQPIAPGAEPLVSLATLFVEHNDEFAANVKREAANLLGDTEYLTRLVNDMYGDKSVVVTIDQFEEVFVLCKDDLSREAFITNLLNLIRPSVGKHRLVLTMRSDRLDYIVRRPDLSELFKEAELRILPLLEPDLLEIIVKPARNIGVKFQPGVVGQLIREIYGDLVGLPLLQFALTKLWEEKEGDTVTWAAMNRLGTCRGALLRSADVFYQSLTDGERRTTRSLVLKMVRLSDTLEVTGDSARRKDFDRLDEPPEQVSAMLAKLVEAQLVRATPACTVSVCTGDQSTSDAARANAVPSPDDQFELAHEALVRYWPELRTWLKNLREAMVTRQRLEAFAANWVILGRGNVGLLDEFQLHEALSWLQSREAAELGYDPDLIALVQMSGVAIRREKMQRKLLRYGIIAAMLLVSVITVAFATRTQQLFRRSVSRQLASQATFNADTQLDQSLLLSLESYRRDKGALEAVSALLAGLTHSPHLSAYLHTPAGVEKQAVKQLAFSPDSKTLISLGNKGATVAWDVEQHRPLDNARLSAQGDRTGAQTPLPEGDDFILSPSGEKLAYRNKDGAFVLWDVKKGAQLWAQPSTEAAFSLINLNSSKFAFSPDEKRMAWISFDFAYKYHLVVWDVEGNRQLHNMEISTAQIVALKYSPDSRVLAYATSDRNIVLLDAETFEPMGKPLNGAYAAEWVFSPLVFSLDSKRLASMPNTNTFIVWNVESQKEINRIVTTSDEAEQASALALSPEGDILVGGYPNGTIVLWSVIEENPTEFHEKHGREVKSITFSNDGKRVVSVSSDNSKVLSWNFDDHFPTELKLGRNSKPETVAFSPDSQTLAAGTDDGTIILWEIGKESMTGRTFAELGGQITGVSFSAEGTKLFTRSQSGSIALYEDLNDSKKVRSLSDNLTRSPEVSSFSPDGKILAASYYENDQNASTGCGIVLWDVAGGNERTIPPSVHTDVTGTSKVKIIAISPDNRLLAAGWSNGDVTLWALDNLTLLHTLKGKTKDSISSLTFNKDGTRLASDGDSGEIKLWNTTNGQLDKSLSLGPNSAEILKHIFTPDSRKLVSISPDSITFWDLTDAGQHVTENNNEVSDIALDSDGRTLVSGNHDGTVSLWDIETHQQLGKLFDGEIPIVSIAYHGSSLTAGRLAVGRQDGSIVLIDVGFETWKNLACHFANRNLTFSEWDTKYKLWEDVNWWSWLWKDKKSLYCTVCPNLPPDKEVPNAKPCD